MLGVFSQFTFSALTGALQGFTHFLNNFAPSTTSEPMICQRLYACIKKLSDPGEIRDHTTFRGKIAVSMTFSEEKEKHLSSTIPTFSFN